MRDFLRRHGLSIVFLAILFGSWLLFSDNDREALVFTGYTMGTTYRLQVIAEAGVLDREEIGAHLTQRLERLDREVFSTYSPESELSAFNAAPVGQDVAVSAELIEVLELARRISDETAGAFDVTVGPLVNLWGFGPEAMDVHVPPQSEIDAAKARVGYRAIEINATARTLNKQIDVYVDLSAIAKGYAVDRLAGYFDSMGVNDYFLEIGGELNMRGTRLDGRGWVPALERPQEGVQQVYVTLGSRGETIAIAGSGDYRNYFELDGTRYSHEIDPRTGRPVSHNLAAVYVIDASTARADALATALMILGYNDGIELARRLELAVYFIVRTGPDSYESFYTDQFGRYLAEEEVQA